MIWWRSEVWSESLSATTHPSQELKEKKRNLYSLYPLFCLFSLYYYWPSFERRPTGVIVSTQSSFFLFYLFPHFFFLFVCCTMIDNLSVAPEWKRTQQTTACAKRREPLNHRTAPTRPYIAEQIVWHRIYIDILYHFTIEWKKKSLKKRKRKEHKNWGYIYSTIYLFPNWHALLFRSGWDKPFTIFKLFFFCFFFKITKQIVRELTHSVSEREKKHCLHRWERNSPIGANYFNDSAIFFFF